MSTAKYLQADCDVLSTSLLFTPFGADRRRRRRRHSQCLYCACFSIDSSRGDNNGSVLVLAAEENSINHQNARKDESRDSERVRCFSLWKEESETEYWRS